MPPVDLIGRPGEEFLDRHLALVRAELRGRLAEQVLGQEIADGLALARALAVASRSRRASASACFARTACREAATAAAASTTRNPAATATAARCFRANFRSRYPADGGHASTGSSARYRWTSRASPLAVSYRRVAVLLQALHHDPVQLAADQLRQLAPAPVLPPGGDRRQRRRLPISRVLGLGGSSSRISRSISARPAARSRFRSSGVVPVSSSYSSTPSE